MPDDPFFTDQIPDSLIGQDKPITSDLLTKYRNRDTQLFGAMETLGGPGAVGAGSAVPFGGDVTITVNQNLSGVHYYNNFTLNSGITISVTNILIIKAKGTITIAGTINADGQGSAGGAGGVLLNTKGNNGGSGICSRGGAGGGEGGGEGGDGGGLLRGGVPFLPVIGTNTTGGAGSITGDEAEIAAMMGFSNGFPGGSGGGGGGSGSTGGATGAGGNGGGAIILTAPTIILTGGTLSCNGFNGGGSGNAPGGGGGGGGCVIITTKNYTAGSISTTGGSGGIGSGAIPDGGAGSPGVVQIDIF